MEKPNNKPSSQTLISSSRSEVARTFDTSLSNLTTQLELNRHEVLNEEDEGSNTFQNVSYCSDSGRSVPKFIECHLENVCFVQCKFRKTEFRNLKLKNVAFLYIDCDNVELSDLSFEGHLWKTTIVRNAWLRTAVRQAAFDSPRTTVLEPFNPLESLYRRSRFGAEASLIVETLRLETPSVKLARSLQHFENTFPLSVQVVLRPQHDLLSRLVDHRHIISQIVRNHVSKKDDLSKRSNNILMIHHHLPPTETREATQNLEALVFCPESTLSVYLVFFMLLHVSITRPTMMNDSLHGPLDCIYCIARRPLYLRTLPSSVTVALHYQFDDNHGLTGTDGESWHALMKCIRHDAADIPAIHLKIEKRFWDIACWKDGVEQVMRQKSLRNDRSNHPNFLHEIAKIAAPADRWLGSEDGIEERAERTSERWDYCEDGTKLQITIDGTDSAEKVAFVRKLADHIEESRQARPYFCPRSGGRYTRTKEEYEKYKKRRSYSFCD